MTTGVHGNTALNVSVGLLLCLAGVNAGVAYRNLSAMRDNVRGSTHAQLTQDEQGLLIERQQNDLRAYHWAMAGAVAAFAGVMAVAAFGWLLRGHSVVPAGPATVAPQHAEPEQALRDAKRRTDELLAALAHELRNSLAPISNALQLWPLVANDPEEMERLRAIMERQFQQLARLVDDLSDGSRIARGALANAREPANLAAQLPRHQILVVDDVHASAKTLAMMLERIGQTVTIAHDGASAIAHVATHRTEIAFLDINMPELDGYEVARRLRAGPHAGSITLVALTGYRDEDDRCRAIEAGFHHHLTKPTSMDKLVQLLGTVSAGRGNRASQPAAGD